MTEREQELYQLQAEVCQTLADPTRLELLHLLEQGPVAVKDLVQATSQRQAKISQHLGVMRQRGIVTARRVGTEMHYTLSDARILDACRITRAVLLDRLARSGALVTVAAAEGDQANARL